MSNAAIADSDIAFNAEEFLRSINIVYDIDAPQRIGHYHPTTKSLSLIRSLLVNQNSVNQIVVAPYGSGKSLLATFVGQLLENKPTALGSLRTVLARLADIDPELTGVLVKRLDPSQLIARPSGLVIPLSGYQGSLGEALCCGLADAIERIGIDTPLIESFRSFKGKIDFALQVIGESKKSLRKAANDAGFDFEKILIIWDEFGRHLEDLIANGDASLLNEIQLVAEFSSRQRTLPISFVCFLHQSLSNYSSGLSQSIRNEWKKIEGRFETIQYVDDGSEVLRLIGKIVDLLRTDKEVIPADLEVFALESIEKAGLFQDMSQNVREDLVRTAYPLEPTTLYLLPRVSARAAQNERTLFSFLYSVDLSEPVSPVDVFDYFEETMRTDTGVGGSFHQWHETQNAVEMTSDQISVEILKTAGILGLGVSGQRSRVSKTFLLYAASGFRHKLSIIRKSIDSLINEKLLLYRKTTDHVAIWYGVDVDLQGRLEQEKARHAYSFNLLNFLREELPPRVWMPLEYNADYRMTRYFPSRYVMPSDLIDTIRESEKNISEGLDGTILHIIPDSYDDIETLSDTILTKNISGRIVVSIPQKHISIYDLALEVFTLRIMQDDDALTGEDPLVLPELRIMSDDALADLNRAMKSLTFPQENGPLWLVSQKQIDINSQKELRSTLSEICYKHFSKTPILNNELIVRKKPRPNLINSRKKLISGILEKSGDPTFGLDGFRPDTSMLRTLLVQTGIYRETTNAWVFTEPEKIGDENLREIWNRFKKLLNSPSKQPKDLSNFFKELTKPPIGLREGVFPVFFAAGLIAFGKTITLIHDGAYVTDILPSTIESICTNPDLFNLYVHDFKAQDIQYLQNITKIFSNDSTTEIKGDLVRETYDAILTWYSKLAPATLKTRKLPPKARSLIRSIDRLIDPIEFLFDNLPVLFPAKDDELCNMKSFSETVSEIDSIVDIFYNSAEKTIREALHVKNTGFLTQDIRQWTALIPRNLVKGVTDSRAVALFNRLLMPQDSAHLLIDSVASLITDKTVNRWDDSTITEFDRLFRTAIAQIEEHAIHKAKESETGVGELTNLAVTRFEHLFDFLVDIVGKEKAKSKVLEMLEEMN